MKTEKCANCGHTATVTRGDYRFDEMGIPLILSNIEIISCSECKCVEPIIPHMNELMNTLALAVVCSPGKLQPKEIKFLRVFLGKTAREFAGLLHVDHTNLSKYENGALEPGNQTDKLIRFLTLAVSTELRDTVTKLLKALPDIKDNSVRKSKIRIDPATQQYQYA